MDWIDQGIVLAGRPYGESGIILSLLTQHHGRHAGLIRRRHKVNAAFTLGNLVQARWRARLSEQLGCYDAIESLEMFAPALFSQPGPFSALGSACALIELTLPERDPALALYTHFKTLLKHLVHPTWASLYAHFELSLLKQLGFGLDFSCCTVTGVKEDLVYVSPRSGKAVSQKAGFPFQDRLLVLPDFLKKSSEPALCVPPEDILAALKLTGYFLERYALSSYGKSLPPARQRLVDRLLRLKFI